MIRLERHEPAKNMQRYYVLDVSPTLFGEWMLTQSWGRIGRAGQMKRQTCLLRDEAERLAARIERQKRGRGYVAQ